MTGGFHLVTITPLRNMRFQLNSGGRSLSSLAAASDEELAIPNEKQFGELLCLERRRAERSRKPFLLMLIDLHKALENDHTDDLVSNVWSSVCSASRDSDIRGWFEQGNVLGVIFVELKPDGPQPVTDIIHSKVVQALSRTLKSEQLEQITINMYLQPDSAANWQQWSGLYRDLREREVSGKLSRALKRGLDIIGSATALFLLSPLMAILSLLVKLSSKGPILFRQRRVGYRGRIFTFLKFRTMREDSDVSVHKQYVQRFISGQAEVSGPAPVYKIKDDPRVTRIGKFLRRTSLDELPQFWNVLVGDMSLVGPRPPIPYEVECYDIWHRRRILEVKPGITGLWQVRGRSRTTFNDMVRLDLQYAKSWSIWLDLKILFATPRAMISGNGAY
jgi:exopolysaccharide biosynthesis polyprenyl glycosylphosphotransferase